MGVRESSIEAYHELKEEGKISEKRSIAFNALKEYAEAEGTDRWPTKVELYEWAQANLDNEEFPFSRFGNFKPRITELTPGSDATDIELVEYLDEKREQDSDTTERSAHPVKILSYQSTLSGEEEAAELNSESSEPVSEDLEKGEVEIPYQVNEGSEVKMGPPLEAIEETDDLDSVVEMLEAKGILAEYQEEVDAARSGSGDSDDVDEDSGDSELVEKDGEEYLFDPEEESDQMEEQTEDIEEDSSEHEDDEDVADSSEEKQGKLLFDKGEVVG